MLVDFGNIALIAQLKRVDAGVEDDDGGSDGGNEQNEEDEDGHNRVHD
eukprot:CAMPEP_0201935012 /NCGR_PEP_ID=MMETSP0903-20130614/34734_1 /ASSEMBLY_ACC=CAM_ASM_000552 /TAXON_ID=420261 /ORGANISM="Thalassiosira antarctica, Strain CCMP982" /LENGTH=47 /DNA_ID= /DNA_START= /DNA_END= /DNA_ORIENTATION=